MKANKSDSILYTAITEGVIKILSCLAAYEYVPGSSQSIAREDVKRVIVARLLKKEEA